MNEFANKYNTNVISLETIIMDYEEKISNKDFIINELIKKTKDPELKAFAEKIIKDQSKLKNLIKLFLKIILLPLSHHQNSIRRNFLSSLIVMQSFLNFG